MSMQMSTGMCISRTLLVKTSASMSGLAKWWVLVFVVKKVWWVVLPGHNRNVAFVPVLDSLRSENRDNVQVCKAAIDTSDVKAVDAWSTYFGVTWKPISSLWLCSFVKHTQYSNVFLSWADWHLRWVLQGDWFADWAASVYGQVLNLPSFIWKKLAGERTTWSRDFVTVDEAEVC